jgi:EmrB/QacA subfamily drug resistance transporter
VLEGQSYVYNAYLLILSALLILAGALNDFFGRRRMFAVGLLGFAATSALCGLAPNMEALVGARILQGAAGALLVPGALALITANFEGEAQGRAYGAWAATSGATSILGPLVGGVLVDTISWRMAFWINLPLVAIALYAVARYVPESRDENASGRFDWLGAAVIALAAGGLAFGATYGQQRDWQDPVAFWAIGLGALGCAVFPVLMARRPHPLVPLGLFRSRNFTVTNIATLVIYGSLYVSFYYVPLFQQGTLGYTALGAGLSFMPGPLLLVFLSTRFGAWATRYGPRWFMAVGPALMGMSLLWLARVPSDSAAWPVRPDSAGSFIPPVSYFIDMLPASLLLGLGLSVMVAPLTTALMQSVPGHNAGLASAINNAISRVGSPLAGALIFVFITTRFYSTLAAVAPGVDPSSPDLRAAVSPLNRPAEGVAPALAAAAQQASTEAFHLAMLVAAAMMFAGALVAALGIRHQGTAEASGAGEAVEKQGV